MISLIEKLEAHRMKLGITKEKMARLIDVPNGTYTRWVNNRRMSPLAVKRIESLEFIKDEK